MKALVVQTSFVGDVVLTTPLLTRLAEYGEVDVLTTPAGAAVLQNHPAVREAIPYDKNGRDRGIGGMLRLARALHSRRYDAAYFAQGSIRSSTLGMLAEIPVRIGFGTSTGRMFYTHRVAYRPHVHHAARLCDLTNDPTVERGGLPRPMVYPSAADEAAVDALLTNVGHRPLVALAPGSRWGTKRWPYFAELAAALPDTVALAIVGDTREAEAATKIEKAARGIVVNGVGHLSILGSAALIKRARALVTNDSAPQHLATAVNTPTIAIFGPTVPDFGFGPLAERSQTIELTGLSCRPCDRHGPERCPLGHWRCMRELTVDDVTAVIDRLLLEGPTT
jgi:heptosyltransferase II